jgi:hypothetical protein
MEFSPQNFNEALINFELGGYSVNVVLSSIHFHDIFNSNKHSSHCLGWQVSV